MNQGKLEVVKQEMARVNVDILGISELKWTGPEEERADEAVIDRLALHKLIRELEPKERQIIVMRYYQEKTQTQIAGELGISQVQVSRLEKRILAAMRKKIS